MRPEQALHRQVVDYLRWAAPDLLFFHCPSGGKRTPAEAGIFKSLGVVPGVPDLCFILPGGRFAGIELKSAKGRLTEAQTVFAARMHDNGAQWACCASLEAVEATLRKWGVALRARAA